MMIGQAKWTDERTALLKKLWLDGLSANGIAKELNCGFTRNAVIGKAHRLKLPGRYDVERKEAVERQRISIVPNSAKPMKAPEPRQSNWIVPYAEKPPIDLRAGLETEPVAPAKPTKKRKIRLFDLTSHTCRFPIGDPRDRDFHFCGKKPVFAQPYCHDHCRASYYCYGHKGPLKYRPLAKAA